MTPPRAFTLIELLVVITIISVLVAAVLASLSSAKGTGNDTALKADLATIETQGVLYYGIGNTYCALTNTSCLANPNTVITDCSTSGSVFKDPGTIADTISSAIASAQKDANGGAANLWCQVKSQAFMVTGQMSQANTYWCIDSTGISITKSSAPNSAATDCSY